MRAVVLSAAAALTLGAPALAKMGFEESYSGQALPTVGAIEVSFNEEIVGVEHGAPRTSGDMLVHPEDVADLSDHLRARLEDELTERGVYAPMVAAPVATLRATVVDVDPSNPGWTENGQRRWVSARSWGLGEAKIEAELIGPAGEVLATYSYNWREAQPPYLHMKGGWEGAERAFSRFSTKVATSIADHSGSFLPES